MELSNTEPREDLASEAAAQEIPELPIQATLQAAQPEMEEPPILVCSETSSSTTVTASMETEDAADEQQDSTMVSSELTTAGTSLSAIP